jgi:hypothetical protein
VGRDGEKYAGDLRKKEMEIFLQKGLDRCVGRFARRAPSTAWDVPSQLL